MINSRMTVRSFNAPALDEKAYQPAAHSLLDIVQEHLRTV
jgi:hypothetical protein